MKLPQELQEIIQELPPSTQTKCNTKMTSQLKHDSISLTTIIGPVGLVANAMPTLFTTFLEEEKRKIVKAHRSTLPRWGTLNVTFHDMVFGVQPLDEGTYLIKVSGSYTVEVTSLREKIRSFWRNIKKKLPS